MKKGKYYIFEVMETLESLYTIVRMYSCYGKHYGVSSKNLKLSYDPAVLLLCRYPKKMKSGYHRDICFPIFVEVLFLITRM